LVQHLLARGDPVHDLGVDRGAERLGEAVEALERRHGAVMTADERLGLPAEVLGGHPGAEDLAHPGEGAVHDPPGPAHDLDLATGLQRDHDRSSASRTRALTSSTEPTAMIRWTSPCSVYQSSTGAVWAR